MTHMLRTRIAALIWVTACTLGWLPAGPHVAADERQTAAELVKQADTHRDRNELDQAEQDYRAALRLLQSDAAADARQQQPATAGLAEILRRKAVKLMTAGAHAKAIPVWHEVARLRSGLFGAGHWQPGNATRAAEVCQLIDRLNDEQKQDWKRLDMLWAKLDQHNQAQQYDQARAVCIEIHTINQTCYGKTHAVTAESLFQVALVDENQGKDKQAEATHRACLKMRQDSMGADHPRIALSLTRLAGVVARLGKLAVAADLYLQSAAMYKRCYSEPQEETAYAFHESGRIAYQLRDYDAAAERFIKSRDAYGKFHRKPHASTALASLALGQTYEIDRKYARAEAAFRQTADIYTKVHGPGHAETISSLHAVTETLRQQEKFAAALKLARECLATCKRTHGEQHALTAASLELAGNICTGMKDFAAAGEYLRKSLQVRTRLTGGNDADAASSLHALARMYHSQEEPAKAGEHYARAIKIRLKDLGPHHADTADSQFELAQIRRDQGRHAEALLLAQQSLLGRLAAYGEEHPLVPESMNLMASLHKIQGDRSVACGAYQKSLDIRIKLFGEQHQDTATSYCNAGLCYLSIGDTEKGGPLLEKSLLIRKQLFGPSHPDTINSYNNVALLALENEDFERAETLFKKSRDGFRKVDGPESPAYATSVFNLGVCRTKQGADAEGRELIEESLAIRTKVLGGSHPETILSLSALAGRHFMNGDDAQAAATYERSLIAGRQRMADSAGYQSERQQLLLAQDQHFLLSVFVSIALENPELHPAAFRELIEWKGAILLRQRQMRVFSTDPAAAKTLASLKHNSARMAEIAKLPNSSENAALRLGEFWLLSMERAQLESELSRLKQKPAEQGAGALRSVEESQPAGSTMLTYFQYFRTQRTKNDKDGFKLDRALAVFVVRKGRPPVLIDLGPLDDVTEAVTSWRASLGRSTVAQQAAKKLRATIWEPVQKYVARDDLILISPDGILGQLPFTALPGKTADSYLLEEYRLAVLPAPRLLPELTRPREDAPTQHKLLLVGGVNYDKQPGHVALADTAWRQPPAAVLRNAGEKFAPLPGAKKEVATIADLFHKKFQPDQGSAVTLTGTDAGEDRFCKSAGRFTHLHLATHGFFTPPDIKMLNSSAKSSRNSGPTDAISPAMQSFLVDEIQPGLNSGIVFSGANRPAKGADDGILTAADIAAMQLEGVDLVVLSACESGLGKSVTGEGMLGVQRAFQAAGARTTIASLWPVGDTATQLLMVRFYRNLWEKKMSKLDALREAQLHLLNHPEEVLDHASFRGDRRIGAPETATSQPQRLSPQFWAAFSLSGGWD